MPPRATPLILVVDDLADVRALFAEICRVGGYAVAAAESAAEGIEKAVLLSPELILMDLGLEDLTGWQAIDYLRQHPVTNTIPVVVVTGHSVEPEPGHPQVCAVLRKPCSATELLQTIRGVFAASA